ncbi:hypothetical protein ACM66B_004566 [Microbotryomycetes sp. NB124-2]
MVGAPSDVLSYTVPVSSWPSKAAVVVEATATSDAGLLTPQTPSRTLRPVTANKVQAQYPPLPTPSPCLPPPQQQAAAPIAVAALRSAPSTTTTTAAAPTISPLAEFFATMFVWTWYKSSGSSSATSTDAASTTSSHKLQVKPSDRFLKFMHDVLTTTQVSHSIVLLALLYSSRLKLRNEISGAPGSEFRSSVVALMIANKVLDDNTYTAKTWCEVSGLTLAPLIAGEQEFLRGLDWQLHVSERDFQAWRKLLKGHVAARNEQIAKVSIRKRSCPDDSLPTVPLKGLGIGAGSDPIERRPVKRTRPGTSGGHEVRAWGAPAAGTLNATGLQQPPQWATAPPNHRVQPFNFAPAPMQSAMSPRSSMRRHATRHKYSSSQTWNAGERMPKPTPLMNKHLHAEHLSAQPVMSRSRSVDCSPVLPPAVHVPPPPPPPHGYAVAPQPSHFGMPVWSQITPPEDYVSKFAFAQSSPAGVGRSLADPYSPQTLAGAQPATLGFYTLGAVKGHIDAATTQRPYLPQPNYVPNPLLQQQQHFVAAPYVGTFSNAGLPGSWWDAHSGCWRILFSPPMPTYC